MKKDQSEKIKEIAEAYTSYWKGKKLTEYKGGPFADRSGGLIQFKHNSQQEAEQLIQNDPFVINEVIEKKWLKEWFIIK